MKGVVAAYETFLVLRYIDCSGKHTIALCCDISLKNKILYDISTYIFDQYAK